MKHSTKVFISYRRADDSKWFSSSINGGLKDAFETFYDVAGGIPYGENFPQVIKESVQKSDVLLAVVGKEYANLFRAKEGTRDFVLEELLEAKASGSLIVPIMTEDAEIPSADKLPQKIAFLSSLNGFEIRHNKLESDIGLLIAYLQKLKPNKTKSQDKRFVNEVFNTLEEKSLVVLFCPRRTHPSKYRHRDVFSRK